MTAGLPALRAPHPHWRFPPGSVVVGQTDTGRLITISAEMRARHLHLAGATGMGKTTCLASMVWQDILEPDGVRRAAFLFDPHGNEAHAQYRRAVSFGIHRLRPVHLLDPASDPVFGLNFFRHRPGVDPAVTAAMAADAVSAVWGGEDLHAKPLLTETLKMIFWSLDWLGATLLEADELTDIADDNPLRSYLIENAPNRSVRRFWRTIEALPPAKRDEKLSAAARRISEFLLPQSTRRIFAARDRAIDFRAAMDDGACLLIDLSYGHGRISKDEARLLGTFMLNDIFLSCLGRPPGSTPVFIYIDEVQLFLTETVAAMLDQARKFGVHLILSHQHLGHLRERGEAIYRSVMTNTRTKIIFGGLDDDDATLMARNLFRGTFDPELSKSRYDKPVVTGQVREWMLSESDSRGVALAAGTTASYGR
ncbi:MAG TPA: type IV secretion system DNA-binding domain-containing protein, partial [Stellaceae bacterium]|nr:type IV secretion system DNA-binding domain-containing protein [Stellaceae bacterium]